MFNSHAIGMSNKENNIYWYGFSWGGIMATCMHYDNNRIQNKEAKNSIEMMKGVAKKRINDTQLYEELIKKVEKNCSLFTPN